MPHDPVAPLLVVLDLAGTTVADEGQVGAAFVEALASHGMVVTDGEVRALRGASKREALLHLLPDTPDRAERADAIFADFRRILARTYAATGVRAIEGAEAVMRRLRARRVRVALNTGFDREITRLLLEALGWTPDIADVVVTGDDVARGRPAPDLIHRAMRGAGVADARRVANVGDTRLDLEAGHRAGVRWNVAVMTGAHSREMLAGAPHTHLLQSVAELESLWPVA